MEVENEKYCVVKQCHCDEEGEQICKNYIVLLSSLHQSETPIFVGNSWWECHEYLHPGYLETLKKSK
ncbi:MAG: hypothetical protein RMZ42_31400 [Nostoc sp. DedQUE05]|nr:hypothetical protein [Nostoc sp. DedQUE05]